MENCDLKASMRMSPQQSGILISNLPPLAIQAKVIDSTNYNYYFTSACRGNQEEATVSNQAPVAIQLWAQLLLNGWLHNH